MTENNYNSVDPKTGTITYDGPSVTTKGNHNNMPSRTESYLATDERGHIQASSLGGTNHRDNIVPQSADLNHGAYYHMEQGEHAALKNGCSIHSEKIAYIDTSLGDRPTAFMVNDTITYPNGETQTVNLSFANLTVAEQESFNVAVSEIDMPDMHLDYGDELRSTMSEAEYAALMEETEPELLDVRAEYDEAISVHTAAEWDFDNPENMTAEHSDINVDWDFDASSEEISAEAECFDDGADISADDN